MYTDDEELLLIVSENSAAADPASSSDPIASFSSLRLQSGSIDTRGRPQRAHPYRRPSFTLSDDTESQSQTQQPQQNTPGTELPVPRTHLRRIRSSRGVRGITYEQMMANLPPISEE